MKKNYVRPERTATNRFLNKLSLENGLVELLKLRKLKKIYKDYEKNVNFKIKSTFKNQQFLVLLVCWFSLFTPTNQPNSVSAVGKKNS